MDRGSLIQPCELAYVTTTESICTLGAPNRFRGEAMRGVEPLGGGDRLRC